MSQPGDDDSKNTEGKPSGSGGPMFGDYRCVFRPVADSLYMMMKHTKTKRVFSNSFSDTELREMDLKQRIDKIVNLLMDAKSGTKSELSFDIAYGAADATQKTAFHKLSKQYGTGDALYVQVGIDTSYYAAEYVFKLVEKQRKEIDLVRDVMEDMQDEIEMLKKQLHNTKPGIASWWTSFSGSGNITMLGEHFKPTMPGMVELSANKDTITIGIPGLYKVSAQVFFSNGAQGTNGHYLYFRVNGTNVVVNQSSQGGGWGYMEYISELKKGDMLTFNTNSMYASNQQGTRFTVQKL